MKKALKMEKNKNKIGCGSIAMANSQPKQFDVKVPESEISKPIKLPFDISILPAGNDEIINLYIFE